MVWMGRALPLDEGDVRERPRRRRTSDSLAPMELVGRIFGIEDLGDVPQHELHDGPFPILDALGRHSEAAVDVDEVFAGSTDEVVVDFRSRVP
jgi:hypothetical protein